jgi:hypothetical protein
MLVGSGRGPECQRNDLAGDAAPVGAVKRLLEAGSDPAAVNNVGLTPQQLAEQQFHDERRDSLIQALRDTSTTVDLNLPRNHVSKIVTPGARTRMQRTITDTGCER